MAKAFIDGLRKCDVEIKEYDLQSDNMEDAKKDLASSNGIILGSPTILSDALPPIYEVMSILNPILNKGMYALSFGSYAWSGEAAINISNRFNMLKFNMPYEPIRVKLNPSEYDLEEIRKIGEEFANIILK